MWAVGNTPLETEELLRPHVDFVGSAARWGVSKPDAGVLRRLIEEAGVAPEKIAYVGDRVDNDILPALAAGLVAVHIRRGPWGLLHETPRGRDRDPFARRAAGGARVSLRVGIGVDAHALVDGVPLVLGGVAIDHPRGLAGHSDGDVLAHALIDAVLGAAGLGDIGSLFPSGDERFRGADSLDLLREAYRQVREAGWTLVNADCVLVGEEPKIAPYRDEMRRRLSDGARRRRGERACDDDRRARLHRSRRGARRARRCAARALMEIVRYADRPDLRELRRAALNEFPEFMNHNAMGWKYWGRLYDEFPEFQLALLDGGELVAEVHALSVPVDGDELPAGWDEAFERGMEAGGGNVLSLLAISVAASRRGERPRDAADRRRARGSRRGGAASR